MEKYDFIKLMLQNRNLSVNDKKRLLLLATREIERVDASLPPIEKEPKHESPKDSPNTSALTIHAPKDTASFLSLFNDPNGFKFLTHDFDPDSDMNYDKLMKQIREQFKEATAKYRIPKNLYALMSAFIFGGIGKDGKVRTWMDCDGKFHKENYASKKWVEWSGNNPNVHLLSNEEIAKEILKFRSSIRLVKPILCDIISRQETKHSNLIIQANGLEKADFYTYVWALENGIKRILDDMARYADKAPNVKISFERSYSDDFSKRIIKITQLGSISSSIEDVLQKFKAGGGAFNEIKNVFYGYCNWSVESLWDGKAKRWNILNDSDADEIEDMENTDVPGFTHILTYFSK